jgi:hypothetical protein
MCGLAGESSRATDAENLEQDSFVRCGPSVLPHEFGQGKSGQLKLTTASAPHPKAVATIKVTGLCTRFMNRTFDVWGDATRSRKRPSGIAKSFARSPV